MITPLFGALPRNPGAGNPDSSATPPTAKTSVPGLEWHPLPCGLPQSLIGRKCPHCNAGLPPEESPALQGNTGTRQRREEAFHCPERARAISRAVQALQQQGGTRASRFLSATQAIRLKKIFQWRHRHPHIHHLSVRLSVLGRWTRIASRIGKATLLFPLGCFGSLPTTIGENGGGRHRNPPSDGGCRHHHARPRSVVGRGDREARPEADAGRLARAGRAIPDGGR